MSEINWSNVAQKISQRRFDDINEDIWLKIVDKILEEPKKRGRKKRPLQVSNEDWSLDEVHKTDQRDIAVVCKYYRLLMVDNVTSTKAIELISQGLTADGEVDTGGPGAMSIKNVERILTESRRREKEFKTMIDEEL